MAFKKAQTIVNRDLLLEYIKSHPGCTKEQISKAINLSTNQIAFLLTTLTFIVRMVLRGKGRGRTGCYYFWTASPKAIPLESEDLGDDEDDLPPPAPTIQGARLIQPSKILRGKEPLRKLERTGVASYMSGAGYE